MGGTPIEISITGRAGIAEFFNTNISNFTNAEECVFFFPPRMILILAGWATLTCIRVIRIDSCEARIELFLQLASQPHSKNS